MTRYAAYDIVKLVVMFDMHILEDEEPGLT
jgi:hypothetical protein